MPSPRLARYAAKRIASPGFRSFIRKLPSQLKGLVFQKGPAAVSLGLQKTKDVLKRPHHYIWESLAPGKTLAAAGKAVRDPAGTMYKGFWKMPLMEKLMLAGFTAPDAMRIAKMEPGKERSEEIGKLVGGTAGWIGTGNLPFLGSMLMWTGAEHAGGKIGKLYGAARYGKKKPEEEPPAVTNKVIKTASATDLVEFVREAAQLAKEGTDG